MRFLKTRAAQTNEKFKKIIEIQLKIIMLMVMLFSFAGLTTSVRAETGEELLNAGKNFIEEGKSGEGNFTVDFFVGEFVGIGQILVGIGVAVLVGVVLVMAIKWITAKPDQMATLKQQTIGIVVAAVVIFGAVGIWTLVQNIMQSVENTL